MEESQARLAAEDAEKLRKGDREEDIDRDSAGVKDVRLVRLFGERGQIPIAEATDWLGGKASTPGKSAKQGAEDETDAFREKLLLEKLGDSVERELDRCRERISSVPKETLRKLQSIMPDAREGNPFGQSVEESSFRRCHSQGGLS